jgi:flagellar FliL protein
MPEESTPAPRKSKSKKGLLITIAAVIVLAGGGAGVYFGFLRDTGDAHKTGAAKKEEPKVRLPAQFVSMDPPFVVNFEPGSSSRFLQIAVELMTRNPEMVEFLKRNSPIIRNDLLLLFGNKRPEDVTTQEEKEALRAAALEAVRKIITEEGGKPEELEAVYFTSFVMQ